MIYCFDLEGCKDCIGCAGLRKKQYCVFNEQLSKKEYEDFKSKLNLCDPETRKKMKSELERLKLEIPHRYMQSLNVENASGNYVFQSKNAKNSYFTDRCEDVAYCMQVVDLKDCCDNNYTEENELCYEYLGAYRNQNLLFSMFCNKVSESYYSHSCHNSKNLFGCNAIRNGQYCILNKQYSKEEYEALVPRVIEHMKKTGEWGEFFSIENSIFGYNETVANEYFPLTKEQALKRGYKWRDDDESNAYQGPTPTIPDNISDIDDEILKQILKCEVSGKLYKIIPQELEFYRKMKLPIPHRCPNQRHKDRLAMRNPQILWDRLCQKCSTTIRTSYSPDRPEKVYCEACYLAEVY